MAKSKGLVPAIKNFSGRRLHDPLGFNIVTFSREAAPVEAVSWSALSAMVFGGGVVSGFMFGITLWIVVPMIIVLFLNVLFFVACFVDSIGYDKTKKALKKTIDNTAYKVVNNGTKVNLYDKITHNEDSYSWDESKKRTHLPEQSEVDLWTEDQVQWVEKRWNKAVKEAERAVNKRNSLLAQNNKQRIEQLGSNEDIVVRRAHHYTKALKDLQEQNPHIELSDLDKFDKELEEMAKSGTN